mgnify:CR=1 FL=1
MQLPRIKTEVPPTPLDPSANPKAGLPWKSLANLTVASIVPSSFKKWALEPKWVDAVIQLVLLFLVGFVFMIQISHTIPVASTTFVTFSHLFLGLFFQSPTTSKNRHSNRIRSSQSINRSHVVNQCALKQFLHTPTPSHTTVIAPTIFVTIFHLFFSSFFAIRHRQSSIHRHASIHCRVYRSIHSHTSIHTNK